MLMAASTDSSITLYRVRDWILLRSLKGHKGRVNSVDAHPAGRVALSVGQDKMLRMWDLVAGKAVSTMKLGVEGDVVRWNTDGTKLAVICGNQLTVYGIDMTVLHALSGPSRFHDVQFTYYPLDKQDETQSEYMLVACEDGKTRVFDIANPSVHEDDEEDEEATTTLEPVALLTGHKSRVKMLDVLEVARPDQPTSTIAVVSASSDGFINVYDLAPVANAAGSQDAVEVEIEPSGQYDTDGSRLTCVNAIGIADSQLFSSQRATGDDEDSEQSTDEEDDEDDEDDEDESEGDGEEIDQQELEEESE
ncbi:Protein mak11 [Microbotryomycetes sp. JL221]|nr:Protein mak11 [Microbotryomycetes sp. JL221]